MNFKRIVESSNAKTYVLPEGWTPREKVAEQLECSPDRVGQHLAPAIKEGTVEVKIFPVWDKITKKVVRVTAYRESSGRPARPSRMPKRDRHGHFVAAK
jgi:predicted ArsR family transcriptional regulator